MNKNIYIMILIIVTIGIWIMFSGSDTEKVNNDNLVNQSEKESVALINAEEFDRRVQDPKVFVLDVHTPEQTHIPGTDAFIDYTLIKESVDQLPSDKNTPILVYCRSGSMSAQAVEDLVELGFTQVFDLQGGTEAYKQSGGQQVVVSPNVQALGTVVYGEVPETEFKLTNYTDQPLQVTRLSTSCGCTQAFMDHREVPAFTTMPVKVTFNPAVHGDDTDLGELTRVIYIETDNPEFAKMEVEITANVVKN